MRPSDCRCGWASPILRIDPHIYIAQIRDAVVGELAKEVLLEAAEKTKATLLTTQTTDLSIQAFGDAIDLLVESIDE